MTASHSMHVQTMPVGIRAHSGAANVMPACSDGEMFYPDNAPQWLGTCDVCGQSPLVAPPPLLVLDDLLLLLNEPTAEVPALCPACAALVSPAADFVRRCRRASRRLRDSLSTDLKEEGWSAGEDSDDDEKPLLHLKRDPSGDEQECVEKKPVKLCKRAKKEKKKKKRVKKEKDDHLEAAQTSPPTSEPREAKVRPARAKREKGVKLEPREEVGADGRKVVKEGRRVVETEEYVVIRLTKEQVREEMAERARGERYLSAPHRCTDCVKGFNYEDVLLAHMERHSEKAGEHQCELCHQYCPSVVSLRGHIKSHTTRYSCKQCGAVRLSRQHLLEHAALAHARAARRYACARCPFTTPKRTMFQKHVRTHAPAAPVACDKCGKMFKTIETLRAHMLMLHSGRPPLRCAECPARFVRSPALRAHVAAHAASRHYCVECDVTFRTRGALAAHLRRTRAHRAAAAPRVTCEVCHKSFGMPAARASHAAWAHEARREHACAACGRRYGSRGGLRAHRRAAHARGERAHACGYCAKAFATRAVLAKHLRTHTGERPYECGECGRSFAQAGTRATHVRLVHRRLPRRAHQGPADQATRQADTFQPPPAELASAAGL